MAEFRPDFSFAALRRLLATGREAATVRLLGDGLPDEADGPTLFVRHDIDISLEHAVVVAEEEAGAGVPAAFLLMTDSPLYDLESRLLGRLRELGHEVGLHVDLGELAYNPELSLADLAGPVHAGRTHLEAALGEPIRTVSFHRPTPSLVATLAGAPELDGLVNAYAEPLMRCYVADSAGHWRHGDPAPVLADPPGPVVQLLVHPIWWAAEHQAPEDRLERFFTQRTAGMAPAEIAAFDASLASVIRRTRRAGLDTAVLDSIPR